MTKNPPRLEMTVEESNYVERLNVLIKMYDMSHLKVIFQPGETSAFHLVILGKIQRKVRAFRNLDSLHTYLQGIFLIQPLDS